MSEPTMTPEPDDTDWEHLLNASSVGTPVGRSLEQRVPPPQRDAVLSRIFGRPVGTAAGEPAHSAGTPALPAQPTPPTAVPPAGPSSAVQHRPKLPTAPSAGGLKKAGPARPGIHADAEEPPPALPGVRTSKEQRITMLAQILSQLYIPVTQTAQYHYVTRRLMATVLTVAGAVPAESVNPILSGPRPPAERRRELAGTTRVDDVALVLDWPGRALQAFWPNEISPDNEDYHVALQDRVFEVDLAPHSYQKQVPGPPKAQHGFAAPWVMVVWRVTNPVTVVEHGITNVPGVVDAWLRRNINHFDVFADMTEYAMAYSAASKQLAHDPFWTQVGISVAIDVAPPQMSESTPQALAPFAESARVFLDAALADERRWFPDAESQIPGLSRDPVAFQREFDRTTGVLRATADCAPTVFNTMLSASRDRWSPNHTARAPTVHSSPDPEDTAVLTSVSLGDPQPAQTHTAGPATHQNRTGDTATNQLPVIR